jgi:fibronectin-binding autotransporter adhesin
MKLPEAAPGSVVSEQGGNVMAAVSWLNNVSGLWGVGSNWSTGTKPGPTDDVTISTASAQTITHNTGSDAIASLSVSSLDTLAMTGGVLAVDGNAVLSGAATESAGTLKFAGATAQIGGTVTQTAGTIQVASGVLSFTGSNDSFAGTLTGATVNFAAGSDTLQSGLQLSVNNIQISGATVTLGASFTDAGAWNESAGTLALGGKTLTLSGPTNFDGGIVNGAGTIAVSGATQISSLELEGSAVLSNTGTITQTGNWYLGINGTDTAQLQNKAGATFIIANNSNIFGTAGTKFTNAGTLIKRGGGDSQIRETTTNTGTITIASGTLSFGGTTNGFGGKIGGPGTLELYLGTDTFNSGLGLSAGYVLLDGANLTLSTGLGYAGNLTQTTGTLALGGKTLTLSGTANFDGGVINGAGTVSVTGTGEINGLELEGSAVLSNGASITQDGNWYLGLNGTDTSQLVNKAGATFTITSNSNIYGSAGAALTNAGTLIKRGGGDSQIRETTTNTGTISVASGTLSFGGSTNSFGGTVSGPGTLELYAGTDTFNSGFALNAGSVLLDGANLTLSAGLVYAGNWTQTTGTLALGGQTLTLSGIANFDGGIINGAGTVAVTGTGEISSLELEGSAVLSNSATITQDGNWYLGLNGTDTSQLVNATGASFIIVNNSNIFGSAGATFTNAGTLIKQGGGDSQIQEATTNTGTITIASGKLSFGGSTNNFGGTVGGPGTLELYGGTDTFNAGLTLTAGSVLLDGANLTLGASLSYAGSLTQTTGTLALGGKTLTLSGAANFDGGVINGAGTLVATGAAQLSGFELEGSAVLRNTGTMTQDGSWYLGLNATDTSRLVNAGGATFTIANNSSIFGVAGALLNNAGTLIKRGGGDSQIRDSITNTGTVTIASGTLSLGGGTSSLGGKINGAGKLELYAGSDTFNSGLALSAGSVLLDGANLTLGASVTYAGNLTQTTGTLALGGKTMTLSGVTSLDGGIINGAGTVAVTGSGEISSLELEGSAVLSNSGSLSQSGSWYLGLNSTDTSQLVNKAGATFLIANNSAIFGTAGAELNNAGTLDKSGGGGISYDEVATINTGLIEVGSGTMSFLAPVSGTGTIDVGSGAVLTFGSTVAAGTTVNLGTDTALTVQATEGFGGQIAGFAAGDLITLAGLGFSGTSLSFNATTDQLTATNTSSSATLQLVGSYTASNFYLFNNAGVAAIGHT